MQPHEILGIPRESAHDIVKAAYRKKALECHPDAGGSAAEFVKLRAAYDSMIKTPETPEDVAERLAMEMTCAEQWTGTGIKRFGELEFERDGNHTRIRGRVRAGSFSCNGDVTIHSDVSSPPWGKCRTALAATGTLHILGSVSNGAMLCGGTILCGNVYGLRRKVADEIKAGVYHDRSMHAEVRARGMAILGNIIGPASVRAESIEVGDIRDGVVLHGRDITIRGNTVTHDCVIRFDRSLTVVSPHLLCLSDDCTVRWPSGESSLRRLKLAGLVGNGITATREQVDFATRRRGLVSRLGRL